MSCPLSNLDANNEKILYEDEIVIIIRTNNLKGHKERMMVVIKEHQKDVSYELEEYALARLKAVSLNAFSYTWKAVIMDRTFGTIKDHWHLVCSDLDPKSDDFDQILKTPWKGVVETKLL